MNNLPALLQVPFEPGEEEIRAYAYHLYHRSGGIPGRSLANWFQAVAYLRANLPSGHSDAERQSQVDQANSLELQAVRIGAGTLFS